MNKVDGKRKVVCRILLGTILLTLLFIFGNSLASREDSQKLSDTVNETVSEVITIVTGKEDSSLEDFFTKYHRKIAHFLEFAVLGAQVLLFLHFSKKYHPSSLVAGALFSFAVATVDEAIQMFSERGDQVADILIDVGGYLCAYALAMLVLCFCARMQAKKALAENKENVHF